MTLFAFFIYIFFFFLPKFPLSIYLGTSFIDHMPKVSCGLLK